jgi:hypothetical protein
VDEFVSDVDDGGVVVAWDEGRQRVLTVGVIPNRLFGA